MKLCVLQKLQVFKESLLVDAASIAQETKENVLGENKQYIY